MAKAKDPTEKTEELARKIWLAGLGAFGQGLDNLQEGYAKMNDVRRKHFEQLVERGSRIEDDARSKLRATGETFKSRKERLRDEAGDLREDGLNLKSRLNELRGSLSNRLSQVGGKLTLPHINSSPELLSEERAAELNKAVDEINKLVALMTAGTMGTPPLKAAEKAQARAKAQADATQSAKGRAKTPATPKTRRTRKTDTDTAATTSAASAESNPRTRRTATTESGTGTRRTAVTRNKPAGTTIPMAESAKTGSETPETGHTAAPATPRTEAAQRSDSTPQNNVAAETTPRASSTWENSSERENSSES